MVWFYKARLVEDGPFVPVKVWRGGPLVDGEILDRHYRWQCQVRGETSSRAILQGDNVPVEVEGVRLRNIQPTTERDYLFMVAHAEFSTKHKPDNHDAAPYTPIDWMKGKTVF